MTNMVIFIITSKTALNRLVRKSLGSLFTRVMKKPNNILKKIILQHIILHHCFKNVIRNDIHKQILKFFLIFNQFLPPFAED